MIDKLLMDGVGRLGLGSPPGGLEAGVAPGREAAAVAALLGQHLAELERWNPRFSFVKATHEELVVRHALDSVAAAPLVARLAGAGGVLDVGSGAGFPGIPLAIALPAVSFTLLERSTKRAAFLENCRVLLGLANVRVIAGDLAAAAGGFDVVTFRAVAPIARLLRDLGRCRLSWRFLAAYKGRRDRIDAELAALGDTARGATVVPLAVPFLDEERHLVILRKPQTART